ncbi:hypothetical protein NGC05_12670 [Staphylococcus succinus]|uniref:hypothetical protein n=1 Tax=Staphylococcus succinus TaxID=61015 RepID=UPI002DB965D6|nr:hypothetical protein [Staphylococcus succinus]MEB7463543.1 hypothetical protein [Staphylococcus succinus]
MSEEKVTKKKYGKQMVENYTETANVKKTNVSQNDQYESFRLRTSIKIHRDFKQLFDELVAEERENKIDFVDELLVFYAQEKYPEILEAFKKQELKTQKS